METTLAFQHCRNIAWSTVRLAHSTSGRRHEARLKAASAAIMADFIAVCVPLILGTFMKPAVAPISAAPG
ncbi:MAG: hypothetical protein ACE1Y7_00490, partial [Lysobacteraceae bacterium]